MKTLPFDDLVIGKMYKAVPSKAWDCTKKAIYTDFKDLNAMNNFIGLIYPSERFVLLEKNQSSFHKAVKLLSADGTVGWVWWHSSTEFKQITDEEEYEDSIIR